MFARLAALAPLALAAVLAGCQSTALPPMSATHAAIETDERGLWNRSQEEQTRLDGSDLYLALPELEAYLEGVLNKLHPDPLPFGGRLYARVLADPTLNAFALPDGAIYLHTGLLARMENEAQLAAVLGHELTHTVHRHALRNFRNVKNQTAWLATLGAGSFAAGNAGSVVQLLGAVGANAAVAGYSRDLEREADSEGFKRLIAAGYEPLESVRVFETMLGEAQQTKSKEPFFFGSHPRLQERIGNFTQLLRSLSIDREPGHLGLEEYEAAIPPVLAANAEAALRAGNFDAATASAQRYLRLRPGDPAVWYLLGEAARKRGTAENLAEATSIFRAITLEHPHFADAHRSLGLLLLKEGLKAEAAACFRQYLTLSPAAADRRHVEHFLLQCDSSS